jgi:hypothetical protein
MTVTYGIDQRVKVPVWDEEALKKAIADEREACAKVAETTVCDTHLPTGVRIYGSKAAAAIRARSKE